MKKLFLYIAGAIIITLLIVLAARQKPERHFDGRVSLSVKDKIPYGCYAAYHLLEQMYPGTRVTTNRLEPYKWNNLYFDSSNQVLIIATQYFDPSESDLDYLTGLAQKGNYILISAIEMNDIACRFFKIEQMYNNTGLNERMVEGQDEISVVDSFYVRLAPEVFPSPIQYGYPGAYYANEYKQTDNTFTYPLGYSMEGRPNMLGIYARKGAIYLHAAPLTLTNFFVLYHNNAEYLQKLMTLVPRKPSRIVWDEYFLNKRAGGDDNSKRGVLSVIMEYTNFRWAFWLVLIVLGLYLLTDIKRRQRMIPDYPKPANESLEFVRAIGKLYYEKGDHGNLALKMTQFFLDQVRQKYKLDTHYINSAFAVQLAARSGITPEEAGHIVDHIHHAQMGRMSAAQLNTFYDLLDNFYKKT